MAGLKVIHVEHSQRTVTSEAMAVEVACHYHQSDVISLQLTENLSVADDEVLLKNDSIPIGDYAIAVNITTLCSWDSGVYCWVRMTWSVGRYLTLSWSWRHSRSTWCSLAVSVVIMDRRLPPRWSFFSSGESLESSTVPTTSLTLWRTLLSYGYSYKASRGQTGLSRHL